MLFQLLRRRRTYWQACNQSFSCMTVTVSGVMAGCLHASTGGCHSASVVGYEPVQCDGRTPSYGATVLSCFVSRIADATAHQLH